MEPLNKIRSELRRYAEGKIEYVDFRPWIVEVYSQLVESSMIAEDELALCESIEWECAQYSDGLIAEPQLRQNLLTLCDSTMIVKSEPLTLGEKVYSFSSGASPMFRVGAVVPVMPASIQILPGMEFEYTSALRRERLSSTDLLHQSS